MDKALRRRHMAHNHRNEYQIRVVRADGIEELSGWMNSTEQVAQAMIAVNRAQYRTCWLMVRTVLCPNCSEKDQVFEYPILDSPSSRYTPHDSRYLQEVESRNRYSLGFYAR
jgi:hypothetical protein